MKRVLLIICLIMIMSVFAVVPADAVESEAGTDCDFAATGRSYQLWLTTTQATDANENDTLNDGSKTNFY